MAWISVHQQLRDHRKLRDFFRILNVSRQEAIGILVLIWMWALDNADRTGMILSATMDDIAETAFWKGSAQKLYSALVESHWIDEREGKMYFHDWDEFNKPFFDYIDRKEKDKLRKREGNSSGKSAEIPMDIPQEFHNSPSPSPSPSPKHTLRSKDICGANPPTHNFLPPTIEEVKIYCAERHNKVDPEKWHDFYTSKNWMIGKNKMKDWKAAVRTWEKESNPQQQSNVPQKGNFEQRQYPDEYFNKLFKE